MKSWHDDVYFGIHYDLHASPGDPALGSELSPDHLKQMLQIVRPDWIQCDGKGHAGWTSWPTQIGSPAPHIARDAMRIHRDVTAELGIKLGVHYSGVWDSRAIELHPEWARIDSKGAKDPDQTSRLSAYLDELMIPQLLELIDTYDVDGFWVDGECWASKPDWSAACQAEYMRRTAAAEVPTKPTDPGWEAWLEFHRELFVEHVQKYADAVHARKPSCAVCSNWMYTMRMPRPVDAAVDYLSGDYTPGWGAERAAIEGRILDTRRRTLGLSWDLMAWGFTQSGVPGQPPGWVFKPALHLKQEVAEPVALGGAVMIYDQPLRTGWLTGWHHETMAEVAQWCRERKAACFQSTSASEVAVAHLQSHQTAIMAQLGEGQDGNLLFDPGVSQAPVEGAVQALLETHRSTDILLEDATLESMRAYKLIVVPEQMRIDDAFLANLRRFVEEGGTALMTGHFLSRDFSDLVGCAPAGDAVKTPLFLEIDGCTVPVSSAPWQAVEPREGVESWALRCANKDPGKGQTTDIVATRQTLGKGQLITVHAPISGDYRMGHYPLLRRWIGRTIDRMEIDWTLKAAPSTSARLEFVLRRKDGKLMVNLINRGAGETLSPSRVIVDELPPITNIEFSLRMPERPESITLAGEQGKLTWEWVDGAARIALERLDVHAVVVVRGLGF
jgi:hypothetical protein